MKSSFLSFCLKLFNAFINLLFVFYVNYKFDNELSSSFLLAYSLTMLFSIMVRFGLDNFLLKFFSSNFIDGCLLIPYPRIKVLFLSIYFVFFPIIIVGISFLINFSLLTSFLILFCVYFQSFNILCSIILQSSKNVECSILTNAIFPLLLCILFFLIFVLTEVNHLLLVFLSANVLTLFFSFAALKRVKLKFSNSVRINFPNFYFPFITIFSQFLIWSPPTFLSIFSHDYFISDFSLLQRLSLCVSFVLSASNYIFAPNISRLYRDSRHDNLKLFLKNVSLVIIPISVFVLFISILMIPFATLFFTPSVDYFLNLYLILCISQFINVFTGQASTVLVMSGNEKSVFICVSTSFLAFCFLSFITLPTLGPLGLVSSFAFSQGFNSLFLTYCFYKKFLYFPVFDLNSTIYFFTNFNFKNFRF